MEFELTEQDVTGRLLAQIDRTICTFNGVVHPEFSKLEFISLARFEEEEEEEKR